MMAFASSISFRYKPNTASAGTSGLTCQTAAEPEPLDIDGEMAYQPQARPPRRQHGPPQGFLGKALQNPEHVIALIAQG